MGLVALSSRDAFADAAVIDPEEAALKWMRRSAAPFPAGATSGRRLRPLARSLGPAQIVGIGEATHGSHEDYAFKADLIRALVQSGQCAVLYVEGNREAAEKLDAFIGGSAGDDAAAAVKASRIYRVWRCEEFAGLMAWLRQWNARGERQVRVIGIDCQASAGDAGYAIDWLRANGGADAATVATSLEAFITPANRTARHFDVISTMTVATHAQTLTHVKALEALLSDGARPWYALPGRDAALAAARSARQGLEAFALDVQDADPSAQTPAYLSLRDRFMAENAVARGAKGVIWAHNMHVIRDPGGEAAGFKPMGGYLGRALGARYKSVVFEFGAARFNAVPVTGDQPPPSNAPTAVIERGPRPETLGAFFAKVGPSRFWIDLSAPGSAAQLTGWRNKSYLIEWPGAFASPDAARTDAVRAPFENLADVVVYFDTLTPSQQL